jgi:hypothetical protein
MYLPVVHYATALLTWTAHLPHQNAYRLITASMTCLGPVTVFLLAFYFTRSRFWSAAAALGYTVFSPSYGLVSQISRDRGGLTHLPWHWHVFVKYGEGPHNMGLALLPVALIALWKAATEARRRQIVSWPPPAGRGDVDQLGGGARRSLSAVSSCWRARNGLPMQARSVPGSCSSRRRWRT